MKSVQLHPGVHCRFIQDDRFKKLQIKVFMQMPLTSTAATAAYLLARYLQRGTERYPEPRQLRMALEHAYGANTSISSMTLGQRSGLVAGLSCLADKFVPGNESVVLEAAEIL